MDIVYSVFSFVLAIGVLVTVHEFGHFWVARRLGVKVLRFSVGFGRPIWSRRAGADQTEYVISALPLGGYVKMLDEREGDVAPSEVDRAFNRKPLAVRFAVVLAGPLFNFFFAVVAYWAMFVIGVTGLKPLVEEVQPTSLAAAAGFERGDEIVAVAGRSVSTWEGVVQRVMEGALAGEALPLEVKSTEGERRTRVLPMRDVSLDELTRGRFFSTIGLEPVRPRIPAVIGRVDAGSPAARGGLRAGDLVVSADGEQIADWGAWVAYVRARPQQQLRVDVVRGGVPMVVTLEPEAVSAKEGVIGRIGAAVQPPVDMLEGLYTKERYSALAALRQALDKTVQVCALTLRMLWKMLLLEVSVENLSGPISIAQYAGSSAQVGIAQFLQFLGIVSVSLGILNLLPIPVLDGGHLMYYVVELFKGSPVSEGAQLFGQRLGIAMLFGLMGLAFYNDIVRLFG